MVEAQLFHRIKDSPLPDQFISENFLHESIRQGKTFAIAEGKYTGGAILNKVTIPGSTKTFHIGTVLNNQKQKEVLLTGIHKEKGQAAKIIKKIGKDSPEMVMEMAKAIRKLRKDDIGIATTVERTNFEKQLGNLEYLSKESTALAESIRRSENEDMNVPTTIKRENIGKLGNLMHVAFSSNSGSIVKSHFLTNEELEDSSFLANLVLVDGYEYLTGNFEQLNNNEIIKKISKPVLTESEIKEMEILKELNQAISNILRQNTLSISSIESCTGGAIADFMTNNYTYYEDLFDSSWVAYDEKAKEVLGVSSSVMDFGMVYSERTAGEMAKALKEKTKSYIIFSTTGIMEAIDTRKFHDDYQPGTVYFAIMIGGELRTFTLNLKLQRRDKMKQEIIKAVLSELLKLLNSNKKIEGLSQEKMVRLSDYQYW